MKATCFGLMRFFGSIGFLCLALGLFYGANHGLGLGIDLMDPFEASHRTKAIMLMAASTVAGLIGLVFGQAIGSSIPVRSDKADAVFCCVWHFGANGSIMWFATTGANLTYALGMEGAKAMIYTRGPYAFAGLVFVIGLLVSVAIGFIYFGLYQFFMRHGKESEATVIPWLLVLLVGALSGVVQSYIFQIRLLPSLLAGLAFTLMLVTLSSNMLMSDLQRRRES